MESPNIFLVNQSSNSNINRSVKSDINIYGSTDIGGGRENQDEFSIFRLECNGHSIVILMILDGHGQNGKFVAITAKETFQKYFSENIQYLVENTEECLNSAYSFTDKEIKNALERKYQNENKNVKRVDGYLTTGTNYPSLISGGTTCTIAVIIDNIHLYISNVGDSDAIIISNTNNNISSEIITGDHSPDNIDEFKRVTGEFTPCLNFQYDKLPSNSKGYVDIYIKDDDGNYHITGKGNYIKNIRRQFAGIVSRLKDSSPKDSPPEVSPPEDSPPKDSPPKDSPFDSTLSMTRSLGDYYLKTYGVSSKPTIKYINLSEIFEESPIISIVVATDGVWDNYTYENISKFSLNEDYLKRINNGENISEEVCKLLIAENDKLGTNHFGKSRDNATAIVAYLKKN